jgi:hypothetical protein
MNSNFFLSLTLGCVIWLELFRKSLETVPKLRVPLELYGVDVSPALGLELSGLLRNMSQFPLVKTWGTARGGLSHV